LKGIGGDNFARFSPEKWGELSRLDIVRYHETAMYVGVVIVASTHVFVEVVMVVDAVVSWAVHTSTWGRRWR